MSAPSPLNILEILYNILSYCNNSAKYRSLLVCQRWSNVGLDLLWYKITDLRPLLKLFGKLKKKSGSYKYIKTPSFASWQRFEKVYQNRIRIIAIEDPDTKYRSALSILSKMRGESPFLPKLHTLQWYGLSNLGLVEPSVMFMHDGMREFEIDRCDDEVLDQDAFTSYCAAISTRMPFLSDLRLGVSPLQIYQEPIVALMKQLPNLEDLDVPPFPDPTEIFLGLAEVPQMKRFRISSVFIYPPSSMLKLSNSRQCVDLETLHQIDLYCTYPFGTKFLQSISSSKTKYLTITSHDPETSGNVCIIISLIATKFSFLTSLQLNNLFLNGRADGILDNLLSQPLAKDMIQMGDLLPILNNCRNISWFELQSLYPADIDDKDVEIIAESWPGLTWFSLCYQPGVLLLEREKRLTLKALSHFSRHCPNMSTLQLYIDARSDHIPDVASFEVMRFAKLNNLDLGPSPINEPGPVVYTLAQLCPLETKLWLWTGSGWGSKHLDDIDPRIRSTWRTNWNAVKAVLPVMLKMQGKIDSLQRDLNTERSFR
ncbi:hypothetical protein BDP27DRAFT_1330737 [Rhodocollybia butyracea]|uniref:F-box domain-containing protein n=1 Tax=Rhodocollybia butyracea TaxID=206335 RepID=A0A9P5PLW9_9AGAR|nr:hypothetical protein BDP27DRAFT_1330737 [Rhodocollybia butyracea]